MNRQKNPAGLDRRDEMILVIIALVVPLLAIPSMAGF